MCRQFFLLYLEILRYIGGIQSPGLSSIMYLNPGGLFEIDKILFKDMFETAHVVQLKV